MKRISKQIGSIIEIFSMCLCLISITAPLIITITSVMGVIEKTQNQALWRVAFLNIFLGIAIVCILCIGEYVFVSQVHQSTLLQVVDENMLFRLPENIAKLNSGLTLLTLIAGFNMIFALFIWKGDGHGLSGTWLFTAGGTPIGISLSAMVPLNIQRKVYKAITKKVGKSTDGPYD